MATERNTARVQLTDKRLLGGTSDVNQIYPLKYPWAWDAYRQGCQNHWTPHEIPMGADAALWELPESKGGLTEAERFMVIRNLGFFSTAETTIANNVVLALIGHMTAAEVRQFLIRQAFEEAIHAEMFIHISESLSLDTTEITNMYNEVESVANKDAFIIRYTSDIKDPGFSIQGDADVRRLLRNLVAQYMCMEGLFFYSGFVMNLSLRRRNKMVCIGEQYSLVMRDEGVHVEFGSNLIRGIRQEHPGAWDSDMDQEVRQMFDEAVALELAYAKACLPSGIMGLNADMFDDYVRHMADRRLGLLGIDPVYGTPNPFEWCSETIDLPKEKNYFETTVTEYQNELEGWD